MKRVTYTIDQVEEFVEKTLALELYKNRYLSLDYETSSLEILDSDFYIIGIGISNGSTSYYLDISSLDSFEGRLSKEDTEKITVMFEKLNSRNVTFLVYNLKFENKVNRVHFNAQLKYLDLYILQFMMGERISLKESCKTLLNLPDWETEVYSTVDSVKDIMDGIKGTAGKSKSKNHVLFENLSWDEFAKNLRERKNAKSDLTATALETLRLKLSEKQLQNLKEIILLRVENRNFDKFFNSATREDLSIYCILDCENTIKLFEYWVPQLKAQKLEKCLSYYTQQYLLGTELEINGCCWDEKEAKQFENQLQQKVLHAYKNLLLLPIMKSAIEESLPLEYDDLTPKLKEKLVVNRIGNSDELKIMTTNNVEDLKYYFNPETTTKENTAVLGRVFLKSPYVKMAVMLQQMKVDIRSEPLLYPNFLKILNMQNKDEILSFIEEKMVKVVSKDFTLYELLKIEDSFNKETEYKFPNFDSDTQEFMYDCLTSVLKCNVDDESTHIPEMKFLFYYKVCRKASKVISANLEGKTGRPVAGSFKENEHGIKIKTSSELSEDSGSNIIRFNFNPLAADTRRWTSSFHVIPSKSEVRKCFTSFSKDQICLHWDMSQLELRVAAFLSEDENMIEAFKSGADVHRYVASKVWQKPENEVSSTERRFAKTCFPGNTKIKLLSGELVTLEELEGKENFYTYSCDKKGLIKPGKVIKVLKTKEVKDLIKITLDDGSHFECTPDHEILNREGKYVPAMNLKLNDSLMPLYSRVNKLGYEEILNNNTQKYEKTHNLVGNNCLINYWDPLEEVNVIHHIDYNKLNNTPENLALFGRKAHNSFHKNNYERSLAIWIKKPESSKILSASAKIFRSKLTETQRKEIYGKHHLGVKKESVSRILLLENSQSWKETRSYQGLLKLILQYLADLRYLKLLDQYDSYRPDPQILKF